MSSPGLDRVLRTPGHFKSFVGLRVKVLLKETQDGRRRFMGDLLEADRQEIVLQVDGDAVRLPLERIEKARLVPKT